MIDLCIVGSGDVVRVRHAPILKELSDIIRVRCIVSKREKAFNEVQKQLGYSVKRAETLDEALKLGMTAALVAVTPASKIDVATYLMRLNIPLYVEIPLGNDVMVAAKFIEESSRQKLPVVIGENFQYQERFNIARSMYKSCGHKHLSHIVVTDNLRRGIRDNPRTDDELFDEHFVQIVSAIRALTGEDIEKILNASKRLIGSITEYSTKCILGTDTQIEIILNIINTCSEDHYSLIFNDADIRISHLYDHNNSNFSKSRYADIIEHWHGSETLLGIEILKDASCGMRKCWNEFLKLIKTKSYKPSPTLINSLNDIQIREAVKLSMSMGASIPIVKFSV